MKDSLYIKILENLVIEDITHFSYFSYPPLSTQIKYMLTPTAMTRTTDPMMVLPPSRISSLKPKKRKNARANAMRIL